VNEPDSKFPVTRKASKNHFLSTAIIATPVILYAFLVVNGWLGANFGFHWDKHIFVGFVDDFHLQGRLIPTFYLYPSFCFYLTLLADGLFHLVHPSLADVPSLVQSTDFSVFSRCIFVCVASLTVVWVYILTLKITKKYWFALLAGLMFCSSFEFSYHSRWAVSDLIAVQFAFLSTTILFLDISLVRRVWLSAFVAGIAAGTKYTAGIVCLNILIALAANIRPWKSAGQAKMLVQQLVPVGVLFAVAFFITTPGCVFHMKTFFRALLLQKSIYAGGHMGYTVSSGWEHLSKIIAYFVLTLFSPLPVASIVISILCLAGTVCALVKKEWNIFGLFVVMFVYVAYVSFFKVMIVRNLLYVLPYFVVLAAYGLFSLHELAKNRKGILAVDAALLCLLAFSLNAVAAASWSIHKAGAIDMKQDLTRFLDKNGKIDYVLSKGIRQLSGSRIQPVAAAGHVIFLKSEIQDEHYPANRFDLYQTIAGPQDVNFNYYPTWSGKDRIVIMKLKDVNREMLDDLNLP
jgi:hypothetical protein